MNENRSFVHQFREHFTVLISAIGKPNHYQPYSISYPRRIPMIAQAENLCHDERIAKSADRLSMPATEPTIDPAAQSFAPTTNASQKGRMEVLELDLIVSDDELKVRVETDQQTVHDYYEAMVTEDDVLKFPPLVVYFDGVYYWLADGHHRYWAIFRRGFKKVLVKVIDGSHDDAVLAAVKLNSKNGLRFNDDDWEKIIPLISQKEQWKNWSNRRLAEELNCSHSTVNKYRPENSVGSGLPTEKRQGKDGKLYPARKKMASKKADTKQEPTRLERSATKAKVDKSLPDPEIVTVSEPEPTIDIPPIPRKRPDILVRNLISSAPKEFVPNMVRSAFQILVEIGEIKQAEALALEVYNTIFKSETGTTGMVDVKDSTEIASIENGGKKRRKHSYEVHFEPDPDDDYFDWITDEEREELRKEQAANPGVRLVPLIRHYTIECIPEHDPAPLIECIFTLFKPQYRKKLLYGLARQMFVEDGEEFTRNIIKTLADELRQNVDAEKHEASAGEVPANDE